MLFIIPVGMCSNIVPALPLTIKKWHLALDKQLLMSILLLLLNVTRTVPLQFLKDVLLPKTETFRLQPADPGPIMTFPFVKTGQLCKVVLVERHLLSRGIVNLPLVNTPPAIIPPLTTSGLTQSLPVATPFPPIHLWRPPQASETNRLHWLSTPTPKFPRTVLNSRTRAESLTLLKFSKVHGCL